MGIWDSLKRWFAPGSGPSQPHSAAPVGRRAATSAKPPPKDQGFGLTELSRRLGVTTSDLVAFKPRYQTFIIAKRSGGQRTITAPDAATKELQRRVLRRLLARLAAHPAAMGFERRQSIATHALNHAGAAVVLRMDIVDFFSATREPFVHHYFRMIGWNGEAAQLLTRLCTHNGGLPQGAPTSPRLSNLVNSQMDARLAGLAAAASGGFTQWTNDLGGARRAPFAKGRVAYTRYADDLTFSFDVDEHSVVELTILFTQWIVELAGYQLHTGKKLRIMRRHDRQTVTGLVVNERVQLPRHRRRWLRAVEHHINAGKPATLTPQQLAGWKSLQEMIVTQTTPGAG